MAFASAVMSLFPAPPRGNSTPVKDNTRRDESAASGLTAAEKQAVIDDLQLEITKRARGLRSIYNEQARQLRESLERRLHRIPPRMRSKIMGELADEHAMKMSKPAQQPAAAVPGANKRSSDVAFAADDKENAQVAYPDLQPQKKRTRVVESQQPGLKDRSVMAKSVLSPRSHNSRTLPSKSASPEKPSRLLAPQPKPRPVSRAVSRQGTAATRKQAPKKPATSEESEGRNSESSTTSARTTIVKRTEPAAKRTTTKKAAPKTTTAATRKRAAPAKTEPAVPAATRTLRKRG